MIKKFNIKDNTFIRYEVIGKGPPILLLHTIRNRLEYSYKVSHLLKKKYTLYLLDLPGFGDSPWISLWGFGLTITVGNSLRYASIWNGCVFNWDCLY